ncbi:MAG: MBL fold metallo-hydrolase [Planctomycetia bacterium]|nr:MBL fold metallo-hydrolase [Planctomycetia bacterium]
MKIRFIGANENVTGARTFVDTGAFRFLVDCGMVQERALLDRNWSPCLENPTTIDAVFLTHAHLDHCGWLPRLGKGGFTGKIYATAATVELAKLILYDSAHIQEEDALFKQKRHAKEKRKGPHPVVPLYTKDDVDDIVAHFVPVAYNKPCDLGHGVQITFYDAGHVLGSAFIEVACQSPEGVTKRFLFSGDLGRGNRPILRDPELFSHADKPVDCVVIESTYGDRVSDPIETVDRQLADIINKTVARHGKVIMPVFAVERAQEMLYRLDGLQESGTLDASVPIFLDSPMAVEATMIFKRHKECFDEETMKRAAQGGRLSNLSLLKTSDESRTLNNLRGPAIIMSSAGMCNAGRIKHHLANHIGNKANTICFLGYQAAGTLGRIIAEGNKSVRIFGQNRKVKAEIASVRGISGHADQKQLLAWFDGIASGAPKHAFVIHGEQKAARTLANLIRQRGQQTQVTVPEYGQTFEI